MKQINNKKSCVQYIKITPEQITPELVKYRVKIDLLCFDGQPNVQTVQTPGARLRSGACAAFGCASFPVK